MQSLILVFFCITVFVVAWTITLAMRNFAMRNARAQQGGQVALIDRPNHRSSHEVPTPRGGGVGIVAAFVPALGVAAWQGWLAWPAAAGIMGSGLAVALLGFVDDCGYVVSAKGRLFLHFCAAVWFLAWIGGVPPFPVFGQMVNLGLAGHVLGAIYLVWLLNLSNFMDGIDGIAAIESITVALGGAVVLWVADSTQHWIVPVAFAAAAAGFLAWNHPPAKIFMGDTGSCFVGMSLGTMSIWAGQGTPHVFWGWAILVGCFAVDATVTLLRRLGRGNRFDEAHGSHAYQHAARKWRSHARVTYAYGMVNVFWLLPLALLVASRRLDGVAGLLIAYAPLVAAALLLKAGAADA